MWLFSTYQVLTVTCARYPSSRHIHVCLICRKAWDNVNNFSKMCTKAKQRLRFNLNILFRQKGQETSSDAEVK